MHCHIPFSIINYQFSIPMSMFNMKQGFLTLAAMLCTAALSLAQTARVQVIHNAPNPTVDVYVNGLLAIDNFAFRTARPFLDLPAGLPLSIAVAPENSTSVADAIATFPATFEQGKIYAVTASGIVGSTATPFTLITDDAALETGTSPTKLSVNVLHGAPDAPAVDVTVRTGSKIVSNLAYGQFTPYLTLDPDVYYLDVKPAGSSTIVGTFKADLSTFAGGAVRILASGLLSGTPAFGLYAVAADGTVLELPNSPVARVQVLHNAPDQTVDVWANGGKLLDDFKFLSGTPFAYLPAGPVSLGVADEFSEAEQDTFYNTATNLVNGKTYLLTALGIPGDPNLPFRLQVFDEARELSSDTNRVELAFQHGTLSFSGDLLDFKENYLNTTAANDLAFGQISAYSAFAPGVGDFGTYLQPTGISLNEGRATNLIKGTTGVVFATNDPASNPPDQLRLLGADGSVKLLGEPRRANLQVVHNAPSPRVDIYYGGNLVFDNADFRHYNDAFVYSDRAASVSVAPDTSTSVKSAIATLPIALEQGKNTAAYVDGVAGDATFPLSVVSREINFGPLNGQVEINVHHGAPGVPAVDVAVVGAGNIFTDLAYGENSGFAQVTPDFYQIQVKKAGTEELLGTFDADFSVWGGQSLNIFASGFTDKNPVFGLYFSVLDGNTPLAGLPAYPLPRVLSFTQAQIIHNAASPTVDVYANGQPLLNDFIYRSATPFVDVPAGIPVEIAVAPENSTSAADAVATFNVVFDESKKYVITASGIVGSTVTPFTLLVNDAAQTESADPTKVSVAVLHGSTDAPAVDVDAVFVANDAVKNLAYGEYTDYLALDPVKHDLAVRATGNADVLASYRADLSALAGSAATVFASGTLSGTPAFGLFAALTDGTVLELPLTPTARVQVIHNSPDPTVDVYAGSTRLLDDFKFRTATPFVTLPADRDIAFGVAGENSASAADALATFPVSFEEGKTYAVFAHGIVGNAATPFTLLADAAREAAAAPAKVEFAILHGAPGAPPVEIDLRLGTSPVLSLDLTYGQFSNYLAANPANYFIRVKVAGTNTVVGTFIADLSTLGGAAARVFASGIVGGTPAFGLFAALPDGTVIKFPLLPPPPMARVQLIHNSASPTVDIYADGELLLDDFEYRTATPFMDILAETLVSIAVAPGNSTSVADAIATFPVIFSKDKKYVVAATGIVGDPTTPFLLAINDLALEAAQTPGQVSVSVLHGSTDPDLLSGVDVDAVFVADNVVSNLAYGQFTASYLSLAPQLYDLAVRAAGNADLVASFRADLSGLAGGAATVFASGTLSGAPAFGLFAALADGTVIQLPLTPTARVQVIHNSPDPTVDVYAGNTRLLNDFKFRTATPFVTLPADRVIDFGVAGEASTSANDALANFPVTFEAGRTYAVFANGIVGNGATPFTLLADFAREAAVDPAKVEFATLHGAPGAAAVDVAVFGGPTLISNLAYGEFAQYLAVDPANYVLQVKPAGSQTVLANFQANLSGLAGSAARVFASGIVGGTPAFGLFATFPDGTVVEFPQIAAPPTARLQVIHNSPSPTVDVYANGALLLDNFQYRTATPFIDVPAGVAITLAVAPENSTSANDALANFPVTFAEGKTYVVTASGIVGDPATPFTLIVNDMGREAAAVPGTVSVSVLHGSTNAPAVDVDEILTGNVLSNLAYGQFTPYLDLPPGIYDLGVRATGTPDPVAIFRADLTGLTGGAATVFASGLVGGTPGFGLFAALANGTVVELPITPTARVQIIHNSPSPTVDVYAGAAKLVDDFAFRTATPFVDVPADRNFRVGVALSTSGSVTDTLVGFPVNFATGKRYTVIANGIVGNATTPFTLAVDDAALESAPAGFVAVSAFHGSPGAPNVDVAERLAGPLFQNVAYGTYTPYLNLPPDEYYLDVKAAGSPDIVATFFADLTGLNGQAARVFASGILGGTPAFGLFAALPSGVVVELPLRPVARVQILHNAPSPTVDVYVFNQLVIDDFEFRTATPFFYIPAEIALPIGVAPGNSQSVNDVIATFPTTFENGGSYIVAASGLVGGTPGFSLIVKDMAREEATNASKLELAVLHGIPDAPAVDILDYETETPVLTDLQYAEFTDYLSLDPDFLLLRVVPTAASAATVGIWAGDFSQGGGLAGVLFATGQLSDDSRGLWLLLPDGTTLPLLPAAEIQVIHNAVGADAVDVYLDEDLALDNFEFRTATNYGLAVAGEAYEFAVAPPNSQSANDAIFKKDLTFRVGNTYTIIASGIVGGSPGFDLFVNENARRAAFNSANVEPNLFHGAPGAPEVDVTTLGGIPVLFDNVQFGEFADYLSVPPANYLISVTTADNSQVVQSYRADFALLGGEAFTVFASGLLGGTPAFEVWVALADGTTFPLQTLVSTNELDEKLSGFAVSPNPAVDEVMLRFSLTQPEALRYALRDLTGRLAQEGDFGTVGAGDFAQRLDVSQLPSGMYTLEVVSDSGVRSVKVVVGQR